jgi:hypothetical protein
MPCLNKNTKKKKETVSENLPESRSNPWGALFDGILPNQMRHDERKSLDPSLCSKSKAGGSKW